MTKSARKSPWGKKKSKMGVYSSLSTKHKVKKKEKAEKIAKQKRIKKEELPKDKWQRFKAHFAWKRIKAYWFSKKGVKRILKIILAIILLGIIGVGALFLYYKNQIASINLDQIKVSDTVNTYLDRNGEVLWEDKGTNDYRLVVDGSEIATSMRQATVAIEDKNFYNHSGVDFGAIMRAAWSTLTGQGVQGGSTLTQQLIKQIYFSEEASDRGITGIPRKIKELILSLELEKMYDKEAIITMYLNQSPYGGRRNGVESAAQTYFNKSAKDLTLAESALLAAIPNNPAVLNPYNENGHDKLIARQHKVLDSMVEMSYITKEEAEEAKSVAILDTIKPEASQYDNIKAPHFVLEVKRLLEEKYGISTMRAGGYTIKTTLDLRAQNIAEAAVATGASLRRQNGSDNIALASVDVETSQVIAMVGSVDWSTPVYGEVNAATSLIEPGSSIKPVLDYTGLFMERDGTNYGPGSILKDENIDSIYCRGNRGKCSLHNASGRFYGALTIRQSLGNSLNIGAVKALYINGIKNGLEVAHALGDESYCAGQEDSVGLSIAIGSGCNVKLIEHANAYASLARGGTRKDLAYVLEMKDSSDNIIEQWEDSEGERVVDEQVAYMIGSILSDPSARTIAFGSQANSFGFVVPGVWTASKTGTTTTANSAITKDSLMISYSTAIATTVWNGNHDGSGLKASSNTIVRRVINDYMGPVHTQLYASEGKWKSGDKPAQPAGIQTLTVNGKTDIWPSWYNAHKSSTEKLSLEFNKYTHVLAAECTPADQRVSVEVSKTTDPVTKQESWYVPDPYNRDVTDDCSYSAPTISLSQTKTTGDDGTVTAKFSVSIVKGTNGLSTYEFQINGATVESGAISSTNFDLSKTAKSGDKVTLKVTDDGGNVWSADATVN